ncbi:hypothetical protein GCAAIG_10590 [Candidatus Electronema halotolerans]
MSKEEYSRCLSHYVNMSKAAAVKDYRRNLKIIILMLGELKSSALQENQFMRLLLVGMKIIGMKSHSEMISPLFSKVFYIKNE